MTLLVSLIVSVSILGVGPYRGGESRERISVDAEQRWRDDVPLISQVALSTVSDGVQTASFDSQPTPGNRFIAVGASRASAPFNPPVPSGAEWTRIELISTSDGGGNKTLAIWLSEVAADTPTTFQWDADRHGALIVSEVAVGPSTAASTTKRMTQRPPLELGPIAATGQAGIAITAAMVRAESPLIFTDMSEIFTVSGDGDGEGPITLSVGIQRLADTSIEHRTVATWTTGVGEDEGGAVGLVVLLLP